jgi:hypothetical protein
MSQPNPVVQFLFFPFVSVLFLLQNATGDTTGGTPPPDPGFTIPRVVPTRSIATTSKESRELLEMIMAEQQRTREELIGFDYQATETAKIVAQEGSVDIQHTLYVLRSDADHVMVTNEDSNLVAPGPPSVAGSVPSIRNANAPIVSRFLKTPEMTVSWIDVLRPRLWFKRIEDWDLGSEPYDADIHGQLARMDPAVISVGFSYITLQDLVSQCARVGDHWLWEVLPETGGIFRINKYTPRPSDTFFMDASVIVDMAHGGVVIETAAWPDGDKGASFFERRSYRETDGRQTLASLVFQEYDPAGTLTRDGLVTFKEYKRSPPDRVLSIADLQVPEGALFSRRVPGTFAAADYFRLSHLQFVEVVPTAEELRRIAESGVKTGKTVSHFR